MRKTILIITTFLLSLGFAQAQHVYYIGNHNGTGKIWKNDTLVQTISDTMFVHLDALQVSPDGTIYTAGHVHDTFDNYIQGRIWLNDSLVFDAGPFSAIRAMTVNDGIWTAAGIANNEWENVTGFVWQNGETLYSYSDSVAYSQIQALYIDTTNNDVYTGGFSGESEEFNATVWKNDTILWNGYPFATVLALTHDGFDLYAAGYQRHETPTNELQYWATLWQNDEIVFSIPSDESEFAAIAIFDGSIYLAGYEGDTLYIWQDEEVLYSHSFEETSIINALVVNESGVYYAGQLDDVATVWKDGEILYQPEDCQEITSLVVIPSEPLPLYTITVESDNPEWGSVSGGGTYYYGDTIQIEAIPNTGYTFLRWEDDNTSNPRTVVVTEDHTYTAYFEFRQCLVQTVVIPEGTGIISGGGAHYYGDTIQLTATAYIGYTFDQWEDGITDNSREVLVTSDTTFTALFTPLQYEVTAACSPVEGGTVEGTGFYDYNTWAVLTAVPNEGYIFLCWSDGIVRNPREILVTQDTYMRAMFYHNATPTYTITVVSNDILLGEVSGSGEYPEGSTIEISATPAANAVFRSWDDGNTDNPRSITVTQDMTYTAIFEPLPQTSYHLIVVSSNALMGSVSGGGTFPANTTTTISATPNNGFLFTGWQDGNTDNPRSVIILSDTLFTAYFAIEPVQTYTITVQYDEYQGYVMGAGTYDAGATARLAAIPNDNYYFVKWGDGVTDNPRDIVVDHDIILAAFFNGTGVDEYDGKAIKLYPNPANDIIRLEGLESEREISIFNTFGSCVKSVTLNGDDEITIGDLTKGLYFLRINGKLTTKFVKQ